LSQARSGLLVLGLLVQPCDQLVTQPRRDPAIAVHAPHGIVGQGMAQERGTGGGGKRVARVNRRRTRGPDGPTRPEGASLTPNGRN
jgi:hypothetical protein